MIYRPSIRTEEYLDIVILEVSSMCNTYSNHYVCIGGDFNFPKVNWEKPYPTNNDHQTRKFVSCIIENGLNQIIEFGTRISNG